MDKRYIINRAEVISVHDEYEGMRIKARLNGDGDGTKTDEEIDYCYPLLPKLLHVNPKPGETVLVLTEKLGASDSQRYFIGPLLSQPYNYYGDMHSLSANSLLKDNNDNLQPLPAPSMNPDNEGSLPDRDDVAILGRRNTDMILKDDEIRIRCGFKQEPMRTTPNNLLFNTKDPAFIQMKFFPTPKHDNYTDTDFRSVINVVADRINLISPRLGNPIYPEIPDPSAMVSDDTLCNNQEGNSLMDAHPLVYGDDLVSLLRQLIEVFRTHTHPFPMMPPTFNQQDTGTLDTDLDFMLSKAVKCN